jgi:antitoxin ParD1/3/4
MPKNTSIALSDHFNTFVTKQVQSGHYGNASEVIRAGLRLLEEQDSKLEWLRSELRKGEASGEPVPLEMEKWQEDLHAEWNADAHKRPARSA